MHFALIGYKIAVILLGELAIVHVTWTIKKFTMMFGIDSMQANLTGPTLRCLGHTTPQFHPQDYQLLKSLSMKFLLKFFFFQSSLISSLSLSLSSLERNMYDK